jgi:hypothetical protein
MKIANIPSKFAIPFASSAGAGYIRTIPQTPTGTAGQASLQQGFPPENFSPVSAGGVPPFGQDFNGLLNQVTSWNQWQATGAFPPYDSAFQTAIGGYPQNSCVASVVTTGLIWLSIVDDNLTNPDTGGAGWIVFSPVTVAAPLLWVRNDGNDNNSGSANDASHAFQTISGAIAAAASRLNLTGRTLTIQLGQAGTYVGGSIGQIPSVTITSVGPASSFIINNSGLAFPAGAMNISAGQLTLNDVSLSNVNNNTHTLQASVGGAVTLTGTVAFGGVAGGSTVADMKCFAGGSVSVVGNVQFNRNVGYAMYAQGSGANISFRVGSNIACAGNAWGTAGILAVENATIELAGNAPTGTASGPRYSARMNGCINVFGGGASYFPGSVAGSTGTGGQYS